jgi:hypothetical protein
MSDDPPPSALPDDIEQYLIVGQRLRATVVLAERRGITFEAARELVGLWLSDRQRRRRGNRPT